MRERLAELSPREWLAHKRNELGADRLFDAPADQLAQLIERIPAEDRDVARDVWMARYDKRIPEIHDELMEQYLDFVRPILPEEEKQVIDRTYFGVFPTGRFEGYAGLTPRGDRIVILNEGLPYTISFWSHWYLKTYEQGKVDFLANDPVMLQQALRHILSVWLGRPPLFPIPDVYPISRDSWALGQVLTMSAISFVLGHEINHIVQNDPDYGPDREINHRAEFAADLAGTTLSMRAAALYSAYKDTYFTNYMLFAPFFALGIISLFGNEDSLTHPSPSRRRDHILTNLPSIWRAVFKDAADAFLEELDENLFSLMAFNSQRLFETFNDYRSLFPIVGSPDEKADMAWARNGLVRARGCSAPL